MAEPRRFSATQREALYVSADGRCEKCSRLLGPGWHADHVVPWSQGGPTQLSNGQALCAACNLRKATSVEYTDSFVPRPFQAEVINAVKDGMAANRDRTVVLASPGSGKTLTFQALATDLFRTGAIDHIAVFVPRKVLARQCETTWKPTPQDPKKPTGNHTLFDGRKRIEKISHRPNKRPLLDPSEIGNGFVTTYSALVSQPAIYREWANEHAGRFLLVADEAQFCGSADEPGGGTKAGALIDELHAFAAHTLLLTGTPYRSDNQRLVLAEYSEPDESGQRRLQAHAVSEYRDGVAEGYLRRFEAYMRGSELEVTLTASGETEARSLDEYLRDGVKRPEVWQPICDDVCRAVREKQRLNPSYRGLISCMEQSEAKAVTDYLRRAHPHLSVLLAISEDDEAAEHALRTFQGVGGDILVTVRKAFIGYDCPEITVVGVLTHYRDWGHLEQLVGRGLRTWKDGGRGQSCRVYAPRDKAMEQFIDYMRGQSEQGLEERAKRERLIESVASEALFPDEIVTGAKPTSATVVSNGVEIPAKRVQLLEQAKADLDMVVDLSQMEELIQRFSATPVADTEVPVASGAVASTSAPQTEQERIDELASLTSKVIRRFLYTRGVTPDAVGRQTYQDRVTKATALVNEMAGVRSGDVRSVVQAEARLREAGRLDTVW